MTRAPEAMENWLKSGEILMRNAFDLTRQCLEFSEMRLHEDFKILGKLMACKDLNQVISCQKAFAEKASSHYFEQFTGMAETMASLAGAAERNSVIDITPMPD